MITLVTGGARSGKSTYGESLYKDSLDVVYIATSRVYDREMEERVNLHKNSRPKEWRTYEGNYNLYEAIGGEKNYFLDCITVLTSNIMFDISEGVDYIDYKLQGEIESKVLKEIKELVDRARENNKNLVLITNELGYSIVPENHLARVFRDMQGRINQRIASYCDDVYLVCCGIPVKIK